MNEKLIQPINDQLEDRNEWIICSGDVCDDCNWICDPTYH